MFTSLTEIFYNTTGETPELTFIGGLLIVGLVIMFGFMCIKWIISLVHGM